MDERAGDRCPILTGRAWAFGPEVPADCIAPGEALDAPSPGRLLMTPVDPDFPARVEAGDILVAGRFGGGTTNAGPVRAIREGGVAAVLASSLDPAFARLALEVGLPALEIYEAMGIHTGEILRVDIEGARVVNMSTGNRYPIRNLDEAVLETYRRHLESTSS